MRRHVVSQTVNQQTSANILISMPTLLQNLQLTQHIIIPISSKNPSLAYLVIHNNVVKQNENLTFYNRTP